MVLLYILISYYDLRWYWSKETDTSKIQSYFFQTQILGSTKLFRKIYSKIFFLLCSQTSFMFLMISCQFSSNDIPRNINQFISFLLINYTSKIWRYQECQILDKFLFGHTQLYACYKNSFYACTKYFFSFLLLLFPYSVSFYFSSS